MTKNTNNFHSVLDNDTSAANQALVEQVEKMKEQMHNAFNKALKQYLASNIFKDVAPEILSRHKNAVGTQNFRENIKQTMLDIAKAIERAEERM